MRSKSLLMSSVACHMHNYRTVRAVAIRKCGHGTCIILFPRHMPTTGVNCTTCPLTALRGRILRDSLAKVMLDQMPHPVPN